MIQLQRPEDCCGCHACGDICPTKAISFKADHEGFLYPEINLETCIDCSLCERVCPVIQRPAFPVRYSMPLVYAAYTKDEAIRIDSTSGGIHSMMAQHMYSNNAYVGGAVYNEDHTVSHIVSDDPQMLDAIRSSKYLQSDLSDNFTAIRKLLQKKKEVFFCGAPCHVEALYLFLKKDYPNLTTCDFICRGVNSPKIFLKYMDMLERQHGAKATKIKFKAKKWGWHNFSMRVNFANGKEYCKDRYHDYFFVGYLQSGNFARPSCYECPVKGINHKADITLADFWGIEKIDPSMDQDKGTSLVLIHSDKGKALFEAIHDKIVYKAFTIDDCLEGNAALTKSLSTEFDDRRAFFDAVDSMPFEKVAMRFFPIPHSRRVIEKKIKAKLQQFKVQSVNFCKLTALLLKFHRFSIPRWLLFLKVNLLNSSIRKSNKRHLLLNYSNCVIDLAKSSCITLQSSFKMGYKQVRGSHLETRLLLEDSAQLIVKNDFTAYAGSFIRVVKDGCLILHGGFINENVQITCGSTIEIGEGATIGRDVVIRSYDGHHIEEEGYAVSEPIIIGKHVWIGQGATILKGVTIGDGAIVAAGAIVTRSVAAGTAVGGNPARVIKEKVVWK